tara:strand:- start:20190 stop:20396 length:207 start_codon:yes stop_codon:yes gene_type:complete
MDNKQPKLSIITPVESIEYNDKTPKLNYPIESIETLNIQLMNYVDLSIDKSSQYKIPVSPIIVSKLQK